MVIRIYWASVSGNRKVNSDQTRLRNLTDMLQLDTDWIDITTDPVIKDNMRRECGNPTAMPPQIFNEEIYLGTVDEFNESVECGSEMQWLKLSSKESSAETNDDTTENTTDGGDTEQIKKPDVVLEEKDENTIRLSVKREVELAPPSKLSSNLFNKFENGDKEDSIKREARAISITKNSEENGEKKVEVDEERKRRLLGLPPLNGVDETNGNTDEQSVEVAAEAVEIKTFDSINHQQQDNINKVESEN